MIPDVMRLAPGALADAIGKIGGFPPHYAELLRAVRDDGIILAEVPRNVTWPRWQLEAARKPVLMLLGDDDEAATGPVGWRALNAITRWPRAAVVHASGAVTGQYEWFGAFAVLVGRLLLVETGSVRAEAWCAVMERRRIPTLCVLPRNGGVHPAPRKPKDLQ